MKRFICLLSIVCACFAQSGILFAHSPSLSLSFKSGNHRALTHAGGFFPLVESESTLTFLNVFGLWDSDGAKEGNLGLGFRRHLGHFIIGLNGFLDRRLSPQGQYHSQATFGLEWFDDTLVGRMNGYLPFSHKKAFVNVKANRINYGHITGFEKGLAGLDIEMGTHHTLGSSHLALYHFNSKGVNSVSGIRLRSDINLARHITLEGEYGYDKKRTHHYFLGLKLTTQKPKDKMSQMVVRDIDIITGLEPRRNAPTPQDSRTQNDAIDLSRRTKLPNGIKSLHLDRQGIFSYENNQGKRYELTDTVGANKAHIIKLQPENWLKHHYLRVTQLQSKPPSYKITALGRILGGSKSGSAAKHAKGEVYIDKKGHEHTTYVDEHSADIRPELPKPREINVILDKSFHFIPRYAEEGNEMFSLLDQRFSKASDSPHIEVITGIAGLGKTQLASAYLYQKLDNSDYDGLFWFQCNDLHGSYERFAARLGLTLDSNNADNWGPYIHQELYHRGYKKVLMIFDDAPSAHIFFESIFSEKSRSIWRGQNVWVLVTSKDRQEWRTQSPIALALMNEEAIKTYIGEINEKQPIPSLGEIKALNAKLQGIPLAITQAIYYMKNNTISIKNYITDFDKNENIYLSYKIKDFTGHEKTIWNNWFSIQNTLSTDAKQFLIYCGYLSTAPIATSLFEDEFSGRIQTILHELIRSALVSLNENKTHIILHELFQRVIFSQNEQVELSRGFLNRFFTLSSRDRFIDIAKKTYNEFNIAKPETYSMIQLWLPHFSALANTLDGSVSAAIFLHQLGYIASFWGQYEKAKTFYQRALAIKDKHYGENHIESAAALHELGRIASSLDDPEKAQKFFERALAIRDKRYGKNHIKSVSTLHCLGNIAYNIGNREKAATLYERVLAIEEKHYGENHIKSAATLHCLGTMVSNLGDTEKAKTLYERTLAIEEKYYGENHIKSAATIICIGFLHEKLGDYEKALFLITKGIALYEHHYKERLQIVMKSASLYDWPLQLNNIAAALNYYQTLLPKIVSTYGKMHHRTAKYHFLLAQAFEYDNNQEDALKYYHFAKKIAEACRSQIKGRYKLEKHEQNILRCLAKISALEQIA